MYILQKGGQTTNTMSQTSAGGDFGNLRAVEKFRCHGKDYGRISFHYNQQESFLLDNNNPDIRPSSSAALLEFNPEFP